MKTLIVDDDPATREHLRAIVEGLGAEIVAEAEDGFGAIERAKAQHPELILLDISMPGLNGFGAARRLRELMPEVPIILVSQHRDAIYAEEALQIGVRAFVVKRFAFTDLAAAIPTVMAGGDFVSPSMATEQKRSST